MEERLFRAINNGERFGPKILMLSPTDYCNLKCKTCWRLKENATFNQPSSDFLKRIIKEAKKMGVETIDLTGGGEPFLRKDILEIMSFIKKIGMKGVITTNATLLKKEHIESIVEMGWDEINFSLDGSTSDINDYIRGKGVFKKVVKVIKLFQNIKENRKYSKPIERLSFVITNKNLNDMENYINSAKKLNINAINFSVLFEWESNKELWLDKKNIKETLLRSLKLSQKLGIKTNLKSIIGCGAGEHKPPKFCFAPWHMLFINASQEAMACCTLASLYQNVLGKVNNLEEIWYGKKMKAFRKIMKSRVFFKECKKCLPEFVQNFNQSYDEMIEWNYKK
jgi:MoaA/NifB/PqqE/SkfB family radical SAM enzyme